MAEDAGRRDGADILGAVRAIAPQLREAAAENEGGRRLGDATVAALRDAGVFRMVMSERLGGPQLDPLAQLDVIEEVSRADGSAGWCTMIGSDGGYATAFLEADVATTMYPSLDLPTARLAAPGGQAVPSGDGYDISGRWPFASGSTHSAWFFLDCLVPEGDGLRLGDGGMPELRMAAVPAADVEVLDTWHTTGLAGSGSHDVTVAGCHVPAERTFALLEDRPVDPAPLYQHRWMFFSNIGAVPLGIARAALEEAVRVAETKVTMPSFALLREEPTLQERVARAEVLISSARAYLWDTVGQAWSALQDGRPIDAAWLQVRLATVNAFHSSKDAVGLVYEAVGTSGIYASSSLDRHLRDVVTMAQHVLAQPKVLTAAGRALVGLPPDAIGF